MGGWLGASMDSFLEVYMVESSIPSVPVLMRASLEGYMTASLRTSPGASLGTSLGPYLGTLLGSYLMETLTLWLLASLGGQCQGPVLED